MKAEESTIVIVGAGPAGCTMACLLAMRGIKTVVFDDEKRPELLVGESLIPSVIPILRLLDIEDRVREFAVFKPGASFFHESGTRVHFKFRKSKMNPGYAYNVPRPQFDRLLRDRASELGVQFVNCRAKIFPDEASNQKLLLDKESLQQANLTQQPDLLIDGTGRSRLFARLLKLSAKRGSRNDVAHFAHYKNFTHNEVDPGQIIISVLNNGGWSWRIPLQGKLSVGIVLDKEKAKALGSSAQERLQNAIDSEPLLKENGKVCKRVSDAMTYSNYQLISDIGHGKNWIMLGDAFGFVDPMLSPGLFMAMESACLLDKYLFSKSPWKQSFYTNALRYEKELMEWHQSWQELITYFYNGSMLRMYEAGSQISEGKSALNPAKLMEKYVSRVIASMASGVATRSSYNKNLLRYSAKHLIWNVPDSDFYAVK